MFSSLFAQALVSGNTAGNDANNLVLSVFNDPAVM
jgi:hypothetical protein